MTRYTKTDGTPLVLISHTLEEWAEAWGVKLTALGCSPEYVELVVATIRSAEEGVR